MPELRRLCGICGRDGRPLYLGRGHPFCVTNRAPLFNEMYIEEHIFNDSFVQRHYCNGLYLFYLVFLFFFLYLAVLFAFITITHSGTLTRSGTFVSRSVGPSDYSDARISANLFTEQICLVKLINKYILFVIIAQTNSQIFRINSL